MDKIIECIPNFSEGRDAGIIREITDAIESVDDIKLLDVSPGKATNRTVVTFVGPPAAVVEAAFRGIQKASEQIDMRHHAGEHPRFGATDVCPLVPIANTSMDETVEYARELAQKTGDELGIPVYCYEFAAFQERRKSLAHCRSGEYESLKNRIALEEWKPDFGPAEWSEGIARTGATAIGARNFLVAYNINLNTTSIHEARIIASLVRESGRPMRKGGPFTGKIVTDENGFPVRIPGTLKKTRAIGWYIKEYDKAQISMNLTDTSVTPVHTAFEEVSKKAQEQGVRVTGSEVVGLIPLQSMLDAGKYFLHKNRRSSGIPDAEIIQFAIKSLGLNELHPFDPDRKIIDYLIQEKNQEMITASTVTRFIQNMPSETQTPGEGSIAALLGALGAALGTLTANKATSVTENEEWQKYAYWAGKCKQAQNKLIEYIDRQNEAYRQVKSALHPSLPGENEKTRRQKDLQKAVRQSIEISLIVMEEINHTLQIIREIAEAGIYHSSANAGMGTLCARTASEGTYLNIKTNAVRCLDKTYVSDSLNKAANYLLSAKEKEQSIMEIVEKNLGN